MGVEYEKHVFLKKLSRIRISEQSFTNFDEAQVYTMQMIWFDLIWFNLAYIVVCL